MVPRSSGALRAALTTDIRRELRREPDTGDLLLALGCAADTPAGRALRELGINLDGLHTTVERVRAQSPPTDEQRIEQVRQEKERAIESQQWETANLLRDEERNLTRAHRRKAEALPREVRRLLGLSSPDTPETTAT